MKPFQLAPLPNTQALVSTTFKVPPLDRSIPEIYDWHLEHTPDHTVFVYSEETGPPKEIKWPELVRAVHTAAALLQSRLQTQGDGTVTGTPVVAILAASGNHNYFTVMIGCLRANYAVHPISTRNSPEAVAHLLEKTNASHLLVGAEESIQGLARHATKLAASNITVSCSLMPSFEDIYGPLQESKELSYHRPDPDAPAVILHSSGTKAFPKPVVWTHFRLLQLSTVPFFGEVDLTGKKIACHGLPMYHGLAMMQTGWTATSGLIMAAFKPQQPAIQPSPDTVIAGSIATKSDILFCVPAFIEYWYRKPEYVVHMRSIHGLLYGGGPLSKHVGDELVSQGVNIFILYGCTEIGIATPIIPKSSDSDWEYFKLSPQSKGIFIPNGDIEGHAELVVFTSKYQTPCVFNGTLNGETVYYTGDLLEPHPSKPDLWRVYGRADDILVHSTGEKTNPVPLEGILAQDPNIKAAVMFGHGRFLSGVLIDPTSNNLLNSSSNNLLEEFKNLIWPTIERMNTHAPQHSRIFKEMILIASPKKPFTYTAKATARRLSILENYKDEISNLYSQVAESTQATIPAPLAWSHEESRVFVRAVVNHVLGHNVLDEDDLFQHGCDRQATWIRNTIFRAIRESTRLDTRGIENHILYKYPSISTMTGFVIEYTCGTTNTGANLLGDPLEEMKHLVSKYKDGISQHSSREPGPSAAPNKTIILTGTTGGFGSALLYYLSLLSEVDKIYALNRPSLNGKSLMNRQENAFKRQDLPWNTGVPSGKVVLLEVDFPKSNFGLSLDVFDELKNSVTHVIHNAWKVDFNARLQSFEPNVKALHSLIQFCLNSPMKKPPSLVFVSSLGVLGVFQGPTNTKETLIDGQSAMANGYTASKWCAEQILQNASEFDPTFQTTSIRVGQICGALSNGYWNPTEWFPLMMKSSVHLQALPACPKPVSWIPMEVAAKVFAELTFGSDHLQHQVFHLAHPRPILFDTLIVSAAFHLKLPVIPYTDWFQLLKSEAEIVNSDSSLLERIPAWKISTFFEYADLDSGTEAMGLTLMDLSRAKLVSKTLGSPDLEQLTAADVEKWLKYWKSVDFM
ncbi:acetyl-CoA synthetase-like protein [Lentinula lateritia]|nr:acetyl-CoA synthetase-like protein [Lentinula lateritia]